MALLHTRVLKRIELKRIDMASHFHNAD
jgi:hypothetical protein